ncbi:MAG: hypothetical protein ACPL4N_03260, partial [Candidatus Norongarragalinales archaeon]
MRKLALLSIVAFVFLIGFAGAKSYYFPQVNVFYDVADDASVSVREQMVFSFSGSYTFAYRDLPQGSWSYSDIG